MAHKKAIRRYSAAAGGWGALRAVGGVLIEQDIAVKGAETLLRVNQPAGFDCPGCAWPDPKHTSSFEFCENGAKAVAAEATARRAGPELFAKHTVAELMRQSEVAAGSTHLYFVFYIAGGVLYLVLTTLSDRVFGVAERRVARSFRGGLGRG